MEISLNEAMKGQRFLTAVQSENASKGYLQVALFLGEDGLKNVECRVFKTGSLTQFQDVAEKKCEGYDLIHATQTYAQGNVFTILYVKRKSENGNGKKRK